jgi:maltose alpha-D-glucosyltransferase / alpha-amylase
MIDDLWYKNAVFYSLDVKTFMDANGDGVGDFQGLARRLDYLQALGVDAVWLGPFQPSPNRDNGYDVSDFYGVDPVHGSSGEFVEFVHLAKQRGIKVLMDLVINHTSDEHPWFQEARRDKSSRHHHWYIWAEERPADWDEGMVFPGVQETTWTLDEETGLYYFHRFYDFQPDMNMDHPEVRKEIMRIIGFWLQLGVNGFRLDAVPFVVESSSSEEKKEIQRKMDYLYEMRAFLQWRSGDAIFLGEANVLPEESKEYFGPQGSGIHMMFNFLVNQNLFYALASGDTKPLVEALESTRLERRSSQWAHFLRNHDELDLGRLTDEQRELVFAKFGPEERMQLYHRGIRRRLAPMLGDRQHLELAYSSIFALPGTPVLRYGDEIAMGDNLELEERDAVRTPMQWGDEDQAGFSTAKDLIHPVIDQGKFGYREVNVEKQRRDENSLLNWTAKMIRIRKECPEIGWGEWEILPTGSPAVLAIRYDWQGTSVVVVHNYSDREEQISIVPGVKRGERLANLLVVDTSHADDSGAHRISLEPYGYRWYRVGDLNHVLHHQEE